jgi:hypothetical protein
VLLAARAPCQSTSAGLAHLPGGVDNQTKLLNGKLRELLT